MLSDTKKIGKRSISNEHNFKFVNGQLGDNMKNTLYGIIILFCFIAASSMDYEEAVQTQQLVQGE